MADEWEHDLDNFLEEVKSTEITPGEEDQMEPLTYSPISITSSVLMGEHLEDMIDDIIINDDLADLVCQACPTPPNSPIVTHNSPPNIPELIRPPSPLLPLPQVSIPWFPYPNQRNPGYIRFYPHLCNPSWYTRIPYDWSMGYNNIDRNFFSGGVVETIFNILDNIQALLECAPGQIALDLINLFQDAVFVANIIARSPGRQLHHLPELWTPQRLYNILREGDLSRRMILPPQWLHIPLPLNHFQDPREALTDC